MTAADATTSARGIAGALRPWEWWVLGGLVAAFAVGVGWVASEPTPLGHDESAYALWGWHWLEGTPGTGVSDHRTPGLLAVVQAAGFAGEGALRAVGVVAGVATVAARWALGRLAAGAVPGGAGRGAGGQLAADGGGVGLGADRRAGPRWSWP